MGLKHHHTLVLNKWWYCPALVCPTLTFGSFTLNRIDTSSQSGTSHVAVLSCFRLAQFDLENHGIHTSLHTDTSCHGINTISHTDPTPVAVFSCFRLPHFVLVLCSLFLLLVGFILITMGLTHHQTQVLDKLQCCPALDSLTTSNTMVVAQEQCHPHLGCPTLAMKICHGIRTSFHNDTLKSFNQYNNCYHRRAHITEILYTHANTHTKLTAHLTNLTIYWHIPTCPCIKLHTI